MGEESMNLRGIVDATIESVCAEICNDYCRYPREWDAEKEGYELWQSDICDNCPLNRL